MVAIDAAKLNAPSDFEVNATSYNIIHISWKKVIEAKGYQIYYSTTKTGTYRKIKEITSANITSYHHEGVKTGTKYYYKVRAVAGDIKSPFTSIKGVAPSLSKVNVHEKVNVKKSEITMSWDAIKGASGYDVYRKSNKADKWKKLTSVDAKTLSYTDKKAISKYYYAVRGYRNVKGTKVSGPLSETKRFSTMSIPQNMKVIVDQDTSSKGLKLTWSKVSGATKYQVYGYNMDTKVWKYHGSTTKTSYRANVEHGVYYKWKVRAVYVYDGASSCGAFKTYTKAERIFCKPNYDTMITTSYDKEAYSILVGVRNNSEHCKMRIYRNQAFYYDDVSTEYDRPLILRKNEAPNYDEVVYIDIEPNETTYMIFQVDGSSTWYSPYGEIYFEFNVDGKKYYTFAGAYKEDVCYEYNLK